MTERDDQKMYDAYYFAHGCGEPYQRSEVWLNLFNAFAERIDGDIQPGSVLDAGCAMGFLVEALRNRGVDAWGVDISEYVISQVVPEIQEYCWTGSITDPLPRNYDLIVSIEVLEHLPKEESEKAVANLCQFSDDILFSSTPNDYKEVSHFNVQPPEYWAELFARDGFFRDVDFDASFITPWAVRYRKKNEPLHRIVRDYERKYWLLWKENSDLRNLTFEMREDLAKNESQTKKSGEYSGGRSRDYCGVCGEIEPKDIYEIPSIMSTDTQLATIVLYTAAPWNSAVVVLRVTGPAEQAGIRVLKGNQGPKVFPDLVSEADLVVIQRDFPRFWPDYKSVISEARYDGKPVLYDLDDLLVEIPGEHSHAGDYLGELLAMLHAILDADVVTASSNHLVEYLSEINPNTRLVNNYLNDELWQIKSPKVGRGEDNMVTIGYMGGQTHQADLTLVENSLLKVCEKYPDKVNLRFWGVQPPPNLMESPFTEWIEINQEDYKDFAEFFGQQDCEILIAPLIDNEFNHSKSSLKFLEYSALGIPGVYSNLPPYEQVVKHGINGYLAESEHDWENHLTILVEDPLLRNEIGTAAQKTIINDWLLSKKYGEWSEVYHQALSGNGKKSDHSQKYNNLLRIISQAEDYQADLENSVYVVGNQLNDILESRSWQTMKSLQNMRLRIMPKGGALDRLLFGRGK